MLTRSPEMRSAYVKPARIKVRPAAWLASLGAAIFLFQIYVLTKWVTGPYFVATPPGPDKISKATHIFFIAMQILCPATAAWMLWNWLVKPWRRAGHITTDGRLIASFAMIFFWDMGMNFSSTVLFYNSYLFNRGDLSLGSSWPGWLSHALRLSKPYRTAPESL